MTLELLTVNQISTPGYHTVQYELTTTDQMGKDSLSDLNVLLTAYQSDFTWR